MMTSDERREVAERLRQMADAHDATEASRVARALGLEYKVYGTVVAFDSADIRNLADLIDPTCHIAPDDWASQQCMGPMLSCDRCQAAFPEINSPYVYCPHCGARVLPLKLHDKVVGD